MSCCGSHYVPGLRARVLTAARRPTMLVVLIKILVRKLCTSLKYFGRSKSLCLLLLLVLLPMIWWLAEQTSRALQPPLLPDQALDHFRRNRSLHHYLSHIQVLIEPSSSLCANLKEVQVITIVASAPHRLEHRQAVRNTWAKHLPTYFVLGLHGDNVDEQLVDTYIEAKQYGDLIIYGFTDHYQNLTLKTALMMKWSLQRCPQAQFWFKTDDDVLVNPWTLRKVLKEHEDAQLLGYNYKDVVLLRQYYEKWYVPRWLHSQDTVSSYLGGSGYLINRNYLHLIFKAAIQVPMINIEDIYFTGMVAHDVLGLTITHDRRLYPHRPWPLACIYWHMGLVHGFAPEEMVTAWSKIRNLGDAHDRDTCWFFNKYLLDSLMRW